MFDIDGAKFDEGRHAYERGVSVRDIAAAVEREHKAANEDQENWRDRERAAHSLVLGYIEGVVGDIRKIANGGRGIRA